MKSVFQQYYDLEKNFEISCFWDDGFKIRFSDLNGYIAYHYIETWKEVEEIFKNKIKELKK